jgi:hypothetical protein
MEKILEYKRKYVKWPSRAKTEVANVKRMGHFLNDQRNKYRGTKRPGLTDDQKTFMDSNEMIEKIVVTEWETKMEKIVEYKETYKKWPSRAKTEVANVKRMGHFLIVQRQKYRGTKRPVLTDDQKTFMELYKMVEKIQERVVTEWGSLDWETRMEKILEYKETYKKWPSKDSKDTDIKRMGQFLKDQRQKYRGTKRPVLTDDQKTFMDSNEMV